MWRTLRSRQVEAIHMIKSILSMATTNQLPDTTILNIASRRVKVDKIVMIHNLT